MGKRPGRNTVVAEDREAIRRSDALKFLLDIVAGKPAPVRDAAGRIVDWTEPPELPLRVSTATALVKKVLPDLAASQIDISGSGEGGIRLILTNGVLPPRSVEEKDITPEPEAIEHQQPVDDDQPPRVRRRPIKRRTPHE